MNSPSVDLSLIITKKHLLIREKRPIIEKIKIDSLIIRYY